jgi:asparagine synthase (glutamine-hydrolysing)|tara:strand:- start:6065 stop:7915 length:1851 start_codon:yes stop_codon:yes gene_type:complete
MCGICGISWTDKDLIKLMGNACKHRGPEQEGFYLDDEISLCCERLRVMDLRDIGGQPIHNENETVWAIQNGEIYNFKELKKRLEDKDHKFYSNTDTEVLVHLYEEFGENFVDHLDGMFACAIWDLKKKKLIIARDRLGVKPMYYWFRDEHLIFASEIKSILQYEEVKRELNYSGLCQFVTYAYTIDGQTLLKNVNELLPGHKLIYDISEKTLKIEKYWNLTLTNNTFSDTENFIQVKKLLENAIDKRKISDAPIGALLSGGLDSSVMVAMLNKLTETPVQTFTTGFGNELDEFNEAQIVANHCETNHTEILIDYSDLTKSLPQILWHMEFPFGRPSILSNYMVAEAIKKYVTVAYTGEGSDELFGGYNRYLPYVKNPEFLNNKNNLETISSGFFKQKEIRDEIFSTNVLKFYENENNPIIAFQKSIDENPTHSALNNALLFELKTEIPGAQTWRIDRTSSAHATELREPFLDYQLVKFCVSVPSHLKINENDGLSKKYILQKIASDLLPPEIVKRKKFPWGIPFYDYFKKEFLPIAQNVLEQSIKNKRDYLNFKSIKFESLTNKIYNSEIQKTKDKEIDDNILRQTMFLFNLEIWHQIFLDEHNFKNPNLDINKFT